MKTRLRYKLKDGSDYIYETTQPLLLGVELINIQIRGTTFYILDLNYKVKYLEKIEGGNHRVKKAVKNYLKSQGVPFADEVRRRKEIV